MSLDPSGVVLPSIDSFDVRYRVPEAPEFGVPLVLGTLGTPGYRSSLLERNERLPRGGVLKLRSFAGDVVARGNPSRFRHWHSVDGVADGMEALSVVNSAVESVAPDIPVASDSMFHRVFRRGDSSRSAGSFVSVAPDGAADLFRVDVCNTYSCGSEANAREFLSAIARRQFGGVQGFRFRNGLTVQFRGASWTVQYYAKWADPYLHAKWIGSGSERVPAPFARERAELAAFLRATGAVRHEVKFSRDWLKARDLRRPSAWTRPVIAATLAEYAPHLGFSVQRYALHGLRDFLEAAGHPPRRVTRLLHVAESWARGNMVPCSRTTRWRDRRDLLPAGIDLDAAPVPGAVEVLSCDLKPLVLPSGFRFWNDEVASSVWRSAPEV